MREASHGQGVRKGAVRCTGRGAVGWLLKESLQAGTDSKNTDEGRRRAQVAHVAVAEAARQTAEH